MGSERPSSQPRGVWAEAKAGSIVRACRKCRTASSSRPSSIRHCAGAFGPRPRAIPRAQTWLERAVELDGSDFDAYLALARLYRDRGEIGCTIRMPARDCGIRR